MVLTVERVAGVQVMTMSRESSRNAIDAELSQALADAIADLEADPTLGCGVLTGAGGHFSAGMDLKAHAAGETIDASGDGIGAVTKRRPGKPLVAAVEGYALAGGFELVLACDMAVASESAVFGLPEVRRGLIAGSGGLLRIAAALPPALAAEIALTGRMLDADEVRRLGLVNRVVPAGDAVREAVALASVVASSSPVAVDASRRLLAAGRPSAEAWRLQDELLTEVFASADAAEGAAAFLERREPRWAGR